MADKRFWFGGHRTIEQQMTGLDQLWPRVVGKSVLDVGCAEGHIAIECERRGAVDVIGIEHRREAVIRANKLARNHAVTFIEADANFCTPPRRFDVILMLAVLHKLREPEIALGRIIDHGAADNCTVVLRQRRSDWPVLKDARSGYRPQDLRFAMYDRGFTLVHEDDGPIDNGQPPEWVGVFERVTS